MNNLSKGFGLIEIMVAMTLGLVITLALIQILSSAKSTYVSQRASASMQEDARFVLSKMIQEIRMVGMFGCLATVKDSSTVGDFMAAQRTPIHWDSSAQKLTLMTADVGTGGGTPSWVVHSDCESFATAYSGINAPGSAIGEQAFLIRKVEYTYRSRSREVLLGPLVLINNVNAFDVLFGVARTASDTVVSRYTANPEDPALIRSIRLSMTLSDPTSRVKSQTFNVVAALRNRLG
jgi:type IV pilus assembly protein PilW